ncbi:DUF1266 domain-containing protein [Deinococcus koreensis]|uniref:DUF1266 domain-containing protein n=1 Tax=Deinococcus koreensis TaxID=2054903 RepID=A0A2K3UWM6_9DEIO|nr:DUF1266 domain-containing protein [Deinococcus koreensis]PNY80938.1 hypothetical protein CVO96_05730 [Deinococcus koreensis]
MSFWNLVLPLLVGLGLAALWWIGKAVIEGGREGLKEAGEELAQEKAAKDAAAAEAARQHQEAVEAAAQALSPADRFALNLRAPFTEVWTDIFEDLQMGRPLEMFYRLTPPAGKESELRESLDEGWDIMDHASAMSSLAWLLGGGHRSQYALVRAAVLAGEPLPELKREAGVVRRWEAQVGEVGALAFDLARAVDVAAQSCALGYLSEAQCWKILNQCRQMVLDGFPRPSGEENAGWALYGQSFLAGAEFWKSGGLVDGARNKRYVKGIQWLLENADSPWRRDPWPADGTVLAGRSAEVAPTSLN